MTNELKRSLRVFDGLAMIVGIMIGSGIFRTPGLVARELGRPWLTFVAWLLGGVLALLGTLVFAELATRFPRAGGKYVYAREAFGPRAGFVVGWVEGLAIYTAAIAAIGVAGAEFMARIAGWSPGGGSVRWIAVALVGGFTGINLLGVSSGRWAQNVITAAKVLALTAVVVIAFAAGTGAGWHGALPGAPTGRALFAALAVAAQSVIWSYYGSVDAAKIAEEVVDPDRTLPRVFLLGIAIVTVLYLLLNAAFLHVLPFAQIAASNLVAGDVATAVFGARGGVIMAALALLVVLASLNGNVYVTPRVIFGLARTRSRRADAGQRRCDAVDGHGADRRRVDGVGGERHVHAVARAGGRPDPADLRGDRRILVRSAGAPAGRAVSGAAVSGRSGRLHRGVCRALRRYRGDSAAHGDDCGQRFANYLGTEPRSCSNVGVGLHQES